MKFHPIADLFPLLAEAELQTLADDIKANGQNLPITVDVVTDSIVDGRNRWLACQRAECEAKLDRRQFADDAAIARFVMSSNIHRRHLSTNQRAAIAAEMANLVHGDNRYTIGINVETPNDVSKKPITVDQAAKIMDVSSTTVDRAKRRMRNDPAAHAAAKAGTKTGTPKAKPRTTATLPPPATKIVPLPKPRMDNILRSKARRLRAGAEEGGMLEQLHIMLDVEPERLLKYLTTEDRAFVRVRAANVGHWLLTLACLIYKSQNIDTGFEMTGYKIPINYVGHGQGELARRRIVDAHDEDSKSDDCSVSECS